MFQTIYQMTPKETQFYHETDRQRFLNLLNLGIESPTKLLIQPHSTNIFTRDEPDCCIVVAYGLPQGQEALFETDWVEERVRSIISIMHSEEELSQMLPTKIVSQIIFFSSTSQFTPLIQLLKSLQKKVKTNPREYRRFDQMIQEHTRRLEALQEAGNSGMNDDDFDDDEFKPMVYKPNNILPLEKLRLSESIRAEVRWFCQKYQHRNELTAAGLPWGNRLLLAGPPGNGKTALACALSKLLNLPIFIVNMGELRRCHIGETGHNMSTLFRGLKHSSLIKGGKAVIFFDECDSVATTRLYEHGADKEDSASLNVLLTNLDQLDAETIVIAATNYPDELDPAFKRRFSAYLWLAPPSPKEIQQFVKDYQKEHMIFLNKKEREQIRSLYGKPWSKITEFCQSIHTARILGSTFDSHHQDWSGKETKESNIGFQANR